MTTENSTPITDTNDLSSFEADFFGNAKPEEKVEESVSNDDAEDTSSDDDTVAIEETDETQAEADDNDAEEEEAPKEKPKGKKSAQERISEINTKYREEQRARIELERRISELEKAPKEEVKTQTPVDTGEPGPDDKDENGDDKYPLGEFDGQLAADRAKYHIEKMWAAKQSEAEQQQTVQREQAEFQTLQTNWTSKLDAAESGELEDIREKAVIVVNEFSNLEESYGDYLGKTLMSMDKGVEVLNYLADNLDEARNIVASGPTAATIALGRIEARFMTESGNKVKPKVTQAPEPPKNLNRGAGGKFEVADDTTDLDAFTRKFYSK